MHRARIANEPEVRMTEAKWIPLAEYHEYPLEEMQRRAAAFCADMQRRRTVRHFSDRPVPRQVIEDCLRAAAAAPSGANKQPWHFVVVTDPAVKRRIRDAAEAEERKFYRAQDLQKWREALAPLGTDEHKPFLDRAPYSIVIFAKPYDLLPNGQRTQNYYVLQSVGIATGILITALHHAGLVSLTYTPSRMSFLNGILGRPANERPFLILVVGYPATDAVVPDLRRKSPEEIATFL
jgi:nitroreductase